MATKITEVKLVHAEGLTQGVNAGNRWTLERNFTVFECLRLRMYKVGWNRVGERERVSKLKSQK